MRGEEEEEEGRYSCSFRLIRISNGTAISDYHVNRLCCVCVMLWFGQREAVYPRLPSSLMLEYLDSQPVMDHILSEGSGPNKDEADEAQDDFPEDQEKCL